MTHSNLTSSYAIQLSVTMGNSTFIHFHARGICDRRHFPCVISCFAPLIRFYNRKCLRSDGRTLVIFLLVINSVVCMFVSHFRECNLSQRYIKFVSVLSCYMIISKSYKSARKILHRTSIGLKAFSFLQMC